MQVNTHCDLHENNVGLEGLWSASYIHMPAAHILHTVSDQSCILCIYMIRLARALVYKITEEIKVLSYMYRVSLYARSSGVSFKRGWTTIKNHDIISCS